jgi:hypothetical protein
LFDTAARRGCRRVFKRGSRQKKKMLAAEREETLLNYATEKSMETAEIPLEEVHYTLVFVQEFLISRRDGQSSVKMVYAY